MRIAVNATFLNQRPGGVGVFTRELVRELAGIEPDLVVFTPESRLFPAEVRCLPSPIRFQGALAFAANGGRFLWCNFILPRLLERIHAAALYCPILEYPFGCRIPMTVTVHDLHPLLFPKQFGAAALHFRVALEWAVRRRLSIVVPSRYVRRQLLARWPAAADRVIPIALGFNRRRFHPQAPGDRDGFLRSRGLAGPYLLFVGSLFPYKNLPVLLRAFRRIRHLVPHSLVVVGRTEVAPPPTPEPRVVYLDYVPQADLPRLYGYADVHVQPSLAEGFGLTVLEAMACGTPVIASQAGSLPEVVADAGLLFPPTDDRVLAALLLQLITDQDLRRELTIRGFRRIRKFHWHAGARVVAAALHRSIAGERNRA